MRTISIVILIASIFFISPTIQSTRSQVNSIDWDHVPIIDVETTEGSFKQSLMIQVYGDEENIYFKASFDYELVPIDPEKVYFAIEIDRSDSLSPMNEGNEMIIVSEKGLDDKPAKTYTYYLAGVQQAPNPSNIDTVVISSINVTGHHYDMIFYRSRITDEKDQQYQFKADKSVRVAFAISEWGKGATHAYTDMAYNIVVTKGEIFLVPVEDKGVGGFRLTREMATLFGQGFLLAGVLGVTVHLVRRKAWRAGKPWDVNSTNDGNKVPSSEIVIERHSRGVRLTHWFHAGLMFFFIGTGLGLANGIYLLGTYTVQLHLGASFFIFANLAAHVFVVSRSGDLERLIIPRLHDFKEMMNIFSSFFGFSNRYPEHGTYDLESEDYYKGRKYHPMQEALFWSDIFSLVLIGITGYALYWPNTLVLNLFGGASSIRALHLLIFYYLSTTIFAHIYLSVIPSNWNRFKSMLSGKEAVEIHKS